MFNENSGLVKVWVRLLTQKNSVYTIEDIPEIDNLRLVVQNLI